MTKDYKSVASLTEVEYFLGIPFQQICSVISSVFEKKLFLSETHLLQFRRAREVHISDEISTVWT